MDLWQILNLVHIIGIAFGVGGASVKITLFMKSYRNNDFTPTYILATRPIAPIVPIGMVLLTVSGIGFALLGYPETQSLLLKHVLVVVLWVVGILIDRVYEPKFITLSPKTNESPTLEFLQVQKQLLALEVIGTISFYAITIIGILL